MAESTSQKLNPRYGIVNCFQIMLNRVEIRERDGANYSENPYVIDIAGKFFYVFSTFSTFFHDCVQ